MVFTAYLSCNHIPGAIIARAADNDGDGDDDESISCPCGIL